MNTWETGKFHFSNGIDACALRSKELHLPWARGLFCPFLNGSPMRSDRKRACHWSLQHHQHIVDYSVVIKRNGGLISFTEGQQRPAGPQLWNLQAVSGRHSHLHRRAGCWWEKPTYCSVQLASVLTDSSDVFLQPTWLSRTVQSQLFLDAGFTLSPIKTLFFSRLKSKSVSSK